MTVAAQQHSGAPPAPAADPTSPPPSLARRFGALSIDWILCLLVTNLYADPIADSWAPVLTLVVVYGFFIGLFAQTPGMRVCRLRCVGYADGGRIGVLRALLRGALLGLVIPAVIMDDRKRGLHDRAAGSIMVPMPPTRPAGADPAR
ncbi:RDD family protein [Plantactinospora sp. CA-294935]|uniref:RDD family protein n=1 Tax=Plantactinospora sp. CA-294935 TaxID=3240012 RepID=UPI003D8FCE5B